MSREKNIKRSRIDWWLVAVILLPALYFLPELLGYNVFAGIDTSRLNMPLRFFDREAFASGTLPLWNPYMFAGFPHLAESESGVFYPGNIFIHLPGDFYHWYSVEVVAHFMIAAAGFYTWMRIRGHSQITSAFLAATYSTTPFLIFHITAFGLFTSIVWLPWYFVIFDLGLRGVHPVRMGLWLALLLGAMLMSGSPQAAFLGVLALILYGIGKIIAQPDRVTRKKIFYRCVAVLLPLVIAPVIAAIQILPTAELTAYSERAATDSIEFYRLGSWLNIPRLISLITFPALDNPADIQDYGSSLCFLGAVPFILAISSIGLWREKGRELTPLLLGGVIALLLGFGLNLPGYEYLVQIPPFSIFRYPGRSAFIALILFLPLAGPAIDLILDKIKKSTIDVNKSWWIGLLAGAAIVVVVGFLGLGKPGIVRLGAAPVFFFGALTLLLSPVLRPYNGSFINNKLVTVTIAALLSFSLIAQITLTYPFSRLLVQERDKFDESFAFFDDIKNEFPTDLEFPRILMPGSHYLMDPDAMSKLGFTAQEDIWDNMSGNTSGLRGMTALRGLTPLNQNDWKLVLRETLQSRIDTVLARSEEFGEPKIPDDISLRIIKMLGTDILLLEGDDWVVPGYELWRDDLALPYHEGLCAYRAVDGWVPDAYFISDQPGMDSFNYPDFLRWAGQNDFTLQSHNGEIISRVRGINSMTFVVSVRGPQPLLLITGENYYPGWNALLDGGKVDYINTNFLLGGVSVPPGEHTIELRYQPKSVLLGMLTTLSGLFIWALLMCVVVWIHRRSKPTIVLSIDEKE